MASAKANKQLHVDKETLATLALAQEKILHPASKLMNKKEATQANETGFFKGFPMPYSFILAPNGKRNQKVIRAAKKGDIVDFIVDGKKVGEIYVEGNHPINKFNRMKNIFGFYDESDTNIQKIVSKFGDYALSGNFKVEHDKPKKDKEHIKQAKERLNAKIVAGIMLGTNPFHRAHERLIRTTLERTDLLVIFLLRPYKTDGLSFKLREKILRYFIDNYLPKDKVLLIPLETTYMFSGSNNLILQCIIAANFGCTELVMGQNHDGIGMYFDENRPRFSLENYKDKLPLKVTIIPEFVFCYECKTLVSTKTCPHGSHRHIKYHGNSLKKMLLLGILPPALFMRKDISSMIISELLPKRFKDVQCLYDNLFPNDGLLENHSDKEFYEELMALYQTSSMI